MGRHAVPSEPLIGRSGVRVSAEIRSESAKGLRRMVSKVGSQLHFALMGSEMLQVGVRHGK